MNTENKKSGAFAAPARAADIASMDEFGPGEFTELTGVGIGDYGYYRITSDGVSLAASDKLEGLTGEQQDAIHQVARRVVLRFPCPPEAFMLWYDATRGEAPAGKAGVSDFPLARGFEETLGPRAQRKSVTSREIISAFLIDADAIANAEWWDRRLRHPTRYGLATARAARGRAQMPSRWYPDLVAVWLIERRPSLRHAVVRAMQVRFSEYPSDHL